MRYFLRLQPFWWTLAVLAFAVLFARGYQNAHSGFRGDDSQLYLGVRQLFRTGSFYRNLDYAEIARPGETVWQQDHAVPNAYPPAAAFFYLPFALFPWHTAHLLWCVMNMGCLAALGAALFRQFGYSLPPETLPVWLFALFLSFPPYVVAFLGQTSFPILLSLVLGWQWARRQGRETVWLAAITYSLALTKTTVTLPILLYQLCRSGSRRGVLLAVALSLLITLAVAGYSSRPAAMIAEYRATVKSLFQAGGLNDTSHGDTGRLTTASVLYFQVVRTVDGHPDTPETPGELGFVRLLEWIVGLGGSAFFFRSAIITNRQHIAADVQRLRDDWAFAALSVFGMVVLYHSWYDLGQLFLPLIVVVNALADGGTVRRPQRLAMLAVLTALLYIVVRTQFVFFADKVIPLPPDTVYAGLANLARVLLVGLFFLLAAEMRVSERLTSRAVVHAPLDVPAAVP